MADETISDEEFKKHFLTYISGKYHPLVAEYGRVLSHAMSCKGEMKVWRMEFDKLKTNFDRVFFILKALERFNQGEDGIKLLGLPPPTEASKYLKNGKSDAIARKCRSFSRKYYREDKLALALSVINYGYFSAVSNEVKADILLERIRLIKRLGADEDTLEEEITNILKCRAADENTQTEDSLRHDIKSLLEIQVQQGNWICSYPDVPESLTGKTIDNATTAITIQGDKFKFLQAKDGIPQLRSASQGIRYAMVASRDISIGEVIFSEKPYASVLNRPYSSICYNCYKRCINIRPCQGCAYVGFCSDKCAYEAKTPLSPLNGKFGRHAYDCGGLLPCLRLDDLFSAMDHKRQSLSLLTFACIANTPANILLDNICSSTNKEKPKDVAYTEKSFVLKSSDYLSVVCRQISTDMLKRTDVWECTVAAVFLAYCLSIAGYPMKWFDEAKEHFFSKPSLRNKPDCLPASWIAARMISHLMNDFNCKKYTEYYEGNEVQASGDNWIATCLYPNISLVSHDCNPTACIVYTAYGGAFLYALRPIKEGEIISVSYGHYYFSVTSTEIRKLMFRNFALFNCSCEACCNNWYQTQKKDFEILKCPFCRSSFSSLKEKCLRCKKADGYLMFQQMLHEKIPLLSNYLKYDRPFGRERISEVVSIMDEVQRLISSPSPTVGLVMSRGMRLVDRTFGARFILLTQ